MALVKKNSLLCQPSESDPVAPATVAREAEAQRKKARTLAKRQQAAERIAAATAQLASGVSEASSAAEELKQAALARSTSSANTMTTSQEILAAFQAVSQSITGLLRDARNCQGKSENAQALAQGAGDGVARLVANVRVAAKRQSASVARVADLEKQAANIGEIVKAVVRIADQTNLLALNAAIEAARAGRHGKGFAVVADEVRTLAETSEQSAKQIQDLVGQIQQEVQGISDGINDSAKAVEEEVAKGDVISKNLGTFQSHMQKILQGMSEIASTSEQSNVAAQQALKGAGAFAPLCEAQGEAASQAAKIIQEQAQALAECEQSAQRLADLADDLKQSTDLAKSAEEVASTSEQMSSAVQEISRAADQISDHLEEMDKRTRLASKAADEAATAAGQIERSLEASQKWTAESESTVQLVRELLEGDRKIIDSLIQGIADSVQGTQTSLEQIKDLERVSRRIDKIIEAITTVSVQTNMLAVNGSIEAARAGEFGKGFVVVSTDIRNLARDSAENADRIKDLVKGIQEQIRVVSNDLGGIVSAALVETQEAKTSTANLDQLGANISDIGKEIQAVAGASNEIAGAIGQVRQSIERIAGLVKQALQSSVEAASSAREQAQGAEELAAAVEEVASLADELQSL